MKVDSKEQSKMLKGAKFNVTIGEGNTQEYTINDQGFVNTSNIPITGTDSDDTITIEETEAPAGYKKLIETIKLKVTKKVQGDAYKVDSVSILEGQGISTPIIDGDVIQVTIPNEKITGSYKLQLVKVDSSNQQTLQGATFSVSLNSGEKKLYTTDGQGEITTSEFEITNTQNDTITIEETGVPSGYSKLIDALTIQVTKTIKDGKYEATGATIISGKNNAVIEEPTIENGVIKIIIPNKKIEGNYGLKLIKVDSNDISNQLEGAKFTVTVGDNQPQQVVTNNEGFVTISNIAINRNWNRYYNNRRN